MKAIFKILIVAIATFVVLNDSHGYQTGSTCVFSPTQSFASARWWNNVSCTISGTTYNFGPTTSNGGSCGATCFTYNLITQNYGNIGFIHSTANSGVLFSIMTATGTLNNVTTAVGPSFFIGREGPMGATGATGSPGATGATGPQGNDGYSAFEIAQINGYTGDVIAWLTSLVGPTGPQGATGNIDFSTFTGAIHLANVVNVPVETGATLDPNGFYFAMTRKVDGVTYMDWIGVRNFLFVLGFLLLVVWLLRYFVNDKKNSLWH